MDCSEHISSIVKTGGNQKKKLGAKCKPMYLTDESKKDDVKMKIHFEKCRWHMNKEDDLDKDTKKFHSVIWRKCSE